MLNSILTNGGEIGKSISDLFRYVGMCFRTWWFITSLVIRDKVSQSKNVLFA